MPGDRNSKDKRPRRSLKARLNEVTHGHIEIQSLSIDYHIPKGITSYHHWKNRIYIWGGASVIGLMAVAFAHITHWASGLFKHIHASHHWLPFILCPVGFVFLRYLGRGPFKGAAGSGIPQVIAWLKAKPSSYQLTSVASDIKLICGKVIGTTLALLSGASIGREGPTVQVAAIVLNTFNKVLRSPIHYSQHSLILAGSAAGMSAAFNTPLAGIVFAIEELSKSFYAKETSVLLMAIVVSGMTALSIEGQYYFFGVTNSTMDYWDIPFALPLGIITGVIGALFSVLIQKGVRLVKFAPDRKAYLFTALLGLSIAIIGVSSAGLTFGTGYDEARAILENRSEGTLYFSFLKFFATLMSYAAGIPGGLFSPSLSIGAGIGAYGAEIFSPENHESFVLLGMVGFLSGVIRAPITCVVIVAEMTANHVMLIPLMLASMCAHGAAGAISKHSVYLNLARDLMISKRYRRAKLPETIKE